MNNNTAAAANNTTTTSTSLTSTNSVVAILNRKLSKREKKEKKKREKKEKAASKAAGKEKDSLAEKLYSELPETSFTRSISNPEAVMRRRRQQKLEKKLQQFSQEGGADAGGTLRIFGESINQDVPYKTILLSTRDTAQSAVKEILEKYGKEKEDPNQYCLVQMIVPFVNGELANGHPAANNSSSSSKDLAKEAAAIREYILDDDDCPLIIERSHNKTQGVLTFHIRRRPSNFQPRKKKKKPGQFDSFDPTMMSREEAMGAINGSGSSNAAATTKMWPYLMEVNPDGTDVNHSTTAPSRRHFLYQNVTEIGSEVSNTANALGSMSGGKPMGRNSMQLFGPNIQPRHCVVHTNGIITVTPCSREAETFVNGTRIYETTILKHGMLVRFGKLHTFRFIDEMSLRRNSQLSTGAIIGQHFQQQQQQQQQPAAGNDGQSYETTFEADGKVETKPIKASNDNVAQPAAASPAAAPTYNTDSLQRHQTVSSLATAANAPAAAPTPSAQQSITNFVHHPAPQMLNMRGTDHILPAILEVWESIEDHFLNIIINRVDPMHVQFKLCITYTFYMVTRYRASTYFRPDILPEDRATLLITFCHKYTELFRNTVEEHKYNQDYLAFWMANASELLNFLKNDKHLRAFTFESQDTLSQAVHAAFNYLVLCQHQDLHAALTTFVNDIVDASEAPINNMTSKLINVLSDSMTLLRRYRVNAALTIQLFSQIFHFINMWLFNKVIGTPEQNYCSAHFGHRLKNCLMQIELWAEKQGLELAAECHLTRIVQTAQFLTMNKIGKDELNNLVTNFYKLNSMQLRALFERYQPMSDEMPFTAEHIDNVIKIARKTTDELIVGEGREIRLEEEPDLQLPFLLPEYGYSCDIVRGIPTGLADFVHTLELSRICKLTTQPSSIGYWTIYFIDFNLEETLAKERELASSRAGSVTFVDEAGRTFGEMMSDIPCSPQPENDQVQALMERQQKQKTLPPPVAGFDRAVRGPSSLGPGGIMEPQIAIFHLEKSNTGMGLSIVAARGTNQTQLGIYIKSVVKGGAADKVSNLDDINVIIKLIIFVSQQDGRLEAGDQLLEVDGYSLLGITQDMAAQRMTQTGSLVKLKVAKQGALFHGLSSILTQQATSTTTMYHPNATQSMCLSSGIDSNLLINSFVYA